MSSRCTRSYCDPASTPRHTNNGFLAVSQAGQAPVRFKITGSAAFNNGTAGAAATGAQVSMIVSNSIMTKNGVGLQQLTGSTLSTPTNNDVSFNGTDTVGTISFIAQR